MTENHPLTIAEVAAILKVSEQSVRTLVRKGKIKAERFGKQWMVDKMDLDQYIKDYDVMIEPADHPRVGDDLPDIVALSFFSGAMGLDLGIEKAGIKALLACEYEKSCRMTIGYNRPDMALIGDINNYSAEEIRRMAKIPDGREIDVMFGGPPCQAFSTAGKRKGFDDQRGNVFLTYLNLAAELQPKILVIENVRGLMSTPYFVDPEDQDSKIVKGAALMYIIKKIEGMGYSVSLNLYNAANYGAPQSRERFVIICRRDGKKANYLVPTHSQDGSYDLPKWRTLGEALDGLNTEDMHYTEFPEERLVYYRMLKEGQYWKDLPKDIQPIAMGKSFNLSGGKTGFYRRLSFDKPSPTLVTDPTMPATDLCHPTELRPLSVEEYRRIQEFPDDWKIFGDIKSQYRQVGNAVPISLGYAVGKAILDNLSDTDNAPPKGFAFSRYKHTSDSEFVDYMEKSIRKEKSKGESKKSSKHKLPPGQTTLD